MGQVSRTVHPGVGETGSQPDRPVPHGSADGGIEARVEHYSYPYKTHKR